MGCEILTIGTELTLGLVNDLNAPYISKALANIGILCDRRSSVPDDIEIISRAVKEAMSRSQITIITGGLGSTHDDLTREGVAKALSRELVLQPMLAAMIEQRFKRLGNSVPEAALRQAYLPQGAEPIQATQGTAPGFVIREDGKAIFVLPGVPTEMRQMLDSGVIQLLKEEFSENSVLRIRCIKTAGESELVIEERIKDVIDKYENSSISILPYPGEVHIQIAAKGTSEEAEDIIETVESKIVEALGDLVFGFDGETLGGAVGTLLKKHKLRLAIIESCTGGALSDQVTSVSGSSEYFQGGVVSYSNELKRKLIGVSREDLLKYGAVSAPVALAMAEGGRHVMEVDIALSVTGIAGPKGGTEEKTVGLVFIGLAWSEGSYCERFQFSGERSEIKAKSSKAALNMLRLFIMETFEEIGGEVS